jgi:hypothetical protein
MHRWRGSVLPERGALRTGIWPTWCCFTGEPVIDGANGKNLMQHAVGIGEVVDSGRRTRATPGRALP